MNTYGHPFRNFLLSKHPPPGLKIGLMSSLNADNPAFQAPHSNWVVQKFGGTSVGKFALNIIEQVVQYEYPLLERNPADQQLRC